MDTTPFPFEVSIMAFTATQIATGAKYALATYAKNEPIDQISVAHRTLDWLIKNKQDTVFGNGSFKEDVFVAHGSNYQNYTGADQVTFNERDPVAQTDFTYYSNHDGFWFDEDRLLAAGIALSDDGTEAPTIGEKQQLSNLLEQSYRGLKIGVQENMAFELLRDGSQSTKACPGLAHVIKTSPNSGIVGGINAGTATYWRNNANTAIVAASVVDEMEQTWKDCMRYGGMVPDFIVCGQAFYENYVAQAVAAIQRNLAVQGAKGAAIDPSVDGVNFHGIPLIWDPTFEQLDTLLGTTTQTKTCYFLNSKALKLRPVKGNWMRDRKPDSLPDRYVTYFAKTSKYGLTSNKRNALAVLTIA